MLDINKLKDKFDEILSSYDEEKIQQWFDFDDNRKLTQKEWENKLKQYAVYETMSATSFDGFEPDGVSNVCRGKQKTHKNHIFKYNE